MKFLYVMLAIFLLTQHSEAIKGMKILKKLKQVAIPGNWNN